MSTRNALLRAALSTALAAYGAVVAAQNYLDTAELKALISGNTVHVEEISTGHRGRAFHDASGQIEVMRDDGGTFAGLWNVGPHGTHCMIVSNEICSRVVANADGTFTRVINGVPAFKWLRITPGKDF